METESYDNFHILETICYHTKKRKVVTKGVFVLDMVNNMYFWGTPKIVKFLEISIKVHEDEIFKKVFGIVGKLVHHR